MLSNSKVLITGACGGIGSCICELFVENNATLFLTGQDDNKLKQFSQKLASSKRMDSKSCNVFYKKCNLNNENDILDLVASANASMGGIDVFIGNAGITDDCLAVKMTKEQWQDVLDVNLTANFLLCREILKIMIKQKHGKIVNISSVVAHTGNKGQVNYSASKAGLIAMTKNMALEYASRGITANCISPGFIDTKMTNTISDDVQKELLKKIPLNRYGKPEDVAQVALFLASSMSNYITGETINVNGGMYMS